jgi:glyoxylase-like metal-dependent hydrolase (beta-lactamase superfamily II)
MEIEALFDPKTCTLTYVVWDPETRDAVIIDPVLDYDAASSTVSTDSVEQVVAFVTGNELRVHYIFETHAHADHLSGSQVLKRRYPEAQIGVGARIVEVQRLFKQVFELPEDFPTDGRQFDVLLEDRSVVQAGSIAIETRFTPGHTPACATYKIEDAVFTGDALFMPDMGTGRCDFPGGSAQDLYRSIQERIYTLPDDTRVFVGHDYQPGGRELRWVTSLADQKANNKQLPADRSEKDFVEARSGRDATLSTPKLLFQSVQVNIDAGALPKPTDGEKRFLKIPVNVFRPDADGDLALEPV